MDATSIITQVSPDDEQLNACPNDKGMCVVYIHFFYLGLVFYYQKNICSVSFIICVFEFTTSNFKFLLLIIIYM